MFKRRERETRPTTFGKGRASAGTSQHPTEAPEAVPVGKTDPKPAPSSEKPKKRGKAK